MADTPEITFSGDYNSGFAMSRLDWINNEDGTYSVVEQFQHPENKADRVLETISEHDYFLLVLEGSDRDRLHEVYASIDDDKETTWVKSNI